MTTITDPNEKAELRFSNNTVRSYSGMEIQPAGELTPLKAAPMLEAAQDDVDFTSGFTDQYRREYENKNDINPQKLKPIYFWYRDPKAVALVIFLLLTFFVGSVMLVTLVFTRNPWIIMVITFSYFLIAILLAYTQARTAVVR